MSTISAPQLPGRHYALPAQQATTKPALPSPVSVAGLLLQAQSQSANSSTDFVTLSPRAQQHLRQSATFSLTGTQRQQVADIIAKHKDAPITQENFNRLQDDLKAIGLAPHQLLGKDLTTSFNPSLSLISAFSGRPVTTPSFADAQYKATNYVQQIYSQWKEASSEASGDLA